MTGPRPIFREEFTPADLWETLIHRGVAKQDAAAHVLRAIANMPENVRREYIKDVDPGKLASFGLGAADMMSFGLGDLLARKLEGQEAVDTQQAAEAQHPAAHLLGEVAGIVGPAAAEMGLVKGGKLALAIRGIRSTAGRAAAKTAVNAATGAAYMGAQVAGHTEGDLGTRLAAGARAAPVGAVIGTVLPWSLATGKFGLSKLSGIVDRVAGPTPEAAARLATPSHVAGDAMSDIAQAMADRQAGKIGEEDFNTAMQFAGGRRWPEAGAPLSPKPAPEPLDVPTFLRRESAAPPLQAGQLAVPGRPDLGVLVEAGPGQKAGSLLRTQSPRLPDMAMRLGNPDLLDEFSIESVMNRLKEIQSSLRPDQITAVQTWLANKLRPMP